MLSQKEYKPFCKQIKAKNEKKKQITIHKICREKKEKNSKKKIFTCEFFIRKILNVDKFHLSDILYFCFTNFSTKKTMLFVVYIHTYVCMYKYMHIYIFVFHNKQMQTLSLKRYV